MIKEKIAKIIRVVTIPPILVLLLLVILFFTRQAMFSNVAQLLLSVLFLMLIPVAAYPLAAVIPKYKAKGRDGERTLAFILSIAGYVAAVVYGFAAQVSKGLLFIYLTYFISVAVLTVFNKVIKLRASGHACSITGPLILMVYFIGWKCLLPCAVLFALIIWASLAIKRHTPRELIAGSSAAALAFLVTLLLMSL
jgi:hypothetical protein